MKIKTLAVTVIALGALAMSASAASAATYIGSGSVAAQPVLTALFAKYSKTHKGENFKYTANGGNAGVKDVQNGKSQFAGQARLPLPSDAGTTYIKMYLDGLCIDVNKANSLSNISRGDLKNIYTGVATNWSSIGGSGLSTTIDPVGRDTNGGTYNFFLQAVLDNQLPSGNVNALTADGLVINAVKQDPNAIGYAGLAWQGSSKLHSVKVDGIPCSPKQVGAEKYPLTRYIFLVVPAENPSAGVLKFANWARRNHQAGVVIGKAGGVPAFNKGF